MNKWSIVRLKCFFLSNERRPKNNIGITTPSQEGGCPHLRITWEASFRSFIQESLLSKQDRVKASITWRILKVRVHEENVHELRDAGPHPNPRLQVLEGGCGCELQTLCPKNDNLRRPSLESCQSNWGLGSGSFSEILRVVWESWCTQPGRGCRTECQQRHCVVTRSNSKFWSVSECGTMLNTLHFEPWCLKKSRLRQASREQY